ncbi:MAG: glycine zipper 2TM domain-containing protein [Pseudomonadota bacterium]
METTNSMKKRNGILYPTMLIAAVAVIIFSVIGIATMTGLMPSARSGSEPAAAGEPVAGSKQPPVPASSAKSAKPRLAAGSASCADCGVVESIRAVENKGQSSGLGAVAGGVVGGIVGNQVGGGRGRTAMTVVGAGAGAYAGNEVEKNMNKSMSYQVRVRMNDGAVRTFYEASPPALAVGQKVRVTERGIAAIG